MDGFINLLKPTGMTSHDVVKVLRRILGEKKTGHTGTLDPMAVGVLPIGVGSATKITEYLDYDYKKYRCELTLGIATDTGDVWGSPIGEKRTVTCTHNDILEAVSTFQGEMLQVPPMYSAVRIGGRRLYEYARSGEEIAVKARTITIHSFDIVDIYDTKVLFDVTCSKGTYIRTICTEIGDILGCGAAMSFLARTRSGDFKIEDTITFEEIQAHIDTGQSGELLLMPVDYPIGNYGRISVNQKQARLFVNGGHLKLAEVQLEKGTYQQYYRMYEGNAFLGMASIDKERKKIVPHKVFYREW